MRRLPILLAAAALAALAAALIAHAGSPGLAFRTPDAGAACKVSGTSLICSSLASQGSVALHDQGHAGIVHGLPWWDASTPVLHHWHHGAISCRLARSAILCRNGTTGIRVTGSGFAVASA